MAKQTLFVGSTNPSKLEEFRLYIGGDANLLGPLDLNLNVEVPETSEDIVKNAERQAVMWSQAQQHPTLSDDTGFFITALGGKPGVSVKTFGGELPEDRTTEEWVAHLLKQTQGIPTDCYFERVVVFSKSGTIIGSVKDILYGTLSRKKSMKVNDSYPLADFFIPRGSDRPWSELTASEQQAYDAAVAQKLHDFIQHHHRALWPTLT